ncbi:2-alkenal reductase [Gammaproteobacteria bacterium 45_16_T64]|nr:2-alkenal reductase [Gammaproteobacteria bacterium 45_16_T64]
MTRFLIIPAVVGSLVAALYIFFYASPQPQSLQPVVQIEEASLTPTTLNRHPQRNQLEPVSYADAVDIAQPAVVNIYTGKIVTRRYNPLYDDPRIRRYFGLNSAPKRQRMERSLGSGVILSEAGYVVTNNHVISEADEIIVALNDGRQVAASVVGTDPETDLAVLFIEAPNLPAITLAQPSNIRVGDVALAIGNPFGVGQTVTKGIVSALGRSQDNLSAFVDFIQTDAAINPGNSGGALINALGQLIGINTAIYSKSGGSQGIGFAIPISIAKKVLIELVQHGEVVRGWLGIEPVILTPQIAETFHLPDTPGLLVSGIFKDGPAHQAGIRPGDIITYINDKAIDDPKAAMTLVTNMRPGEKVAIGFIREGKKHRLVATVGSRPSPK